MADGRVIGDDVMVGPDIALDSHRATPGCLFVAVAGRRVDGHDFVAAAADGGAVAALVAHPVDAGIAQIVVDDPTNALGAIARHIAAPARAHGMATLALTGSSGKTTTKDMLAQILEPVGPTVSPVGSYNSKLGLPVTVAGVDETTRFLVAEMGAAGVGDIAWLCAVAPPDIAAVLNVGHAHLGEFGSREAIAQAKGEIVEALPATGWAVLNADDPLVAAMASRTTAQVAWFSAAGAEMPDSPFSVEARQIAFDDLDRATFHLVGRTPAGAFDKTVTLRVIGAHQVADACAAAAMALCAGLTPHEVAVGLCAAVRRSGWRMEPVALAGGRLLLNDAYNANPDSVAAALASLGRLSASRGVVAVAVLGDMLELGPDSPRFHEEIGAQAAGIGADVVAVGQFAGAIAEGARRAGGKADTMDRDDVADWLEASPYGVVLLKASRGVGLESVADKLRGGLA